MLRLAWLLGLRSACTHVCRSMQQACCAVQPLCGVVEGLPRARGGELAEVHALGQYGTN
jgi:hypothetical protein